MADLGRQPNMNYLFQDLALRDATVRAVLVQMQQGTFTYEQALLYIIKLLDERQVILMNALLETKQKHKLEHWINNENVIM